MMTITYKHLQSAIANGSTLPSEAQENRSAILTSLYDDLIRAQNQLTDLIQEWQRQQDLDRWQRTLSPEQVAILKAIPVSVHDITIEGQAVHLVLPRSWYRDLDAIEQTRRIIKRLGYETVAISEHESKNPQSYTLKS